MEKAVKITLIITSAIVILALLGFFAYYQFAGKSISVQGNSVVKANPDIVKVYFNVETTGATSSEANSKNSEIVDKMKVALIKIGIAEDKIVTQNFQVNVWQEWENNKMADKGYKADHQIVIELLEEQFSLIGKVIDAGANSEATIQYINFELSNAKQNEYKALAFKQASEDARIKAEGIAEGLGSRLGGIKSVTVNEWGYNPWPIYSNGGGVAMAEAADAKLATTNIQPGEQDISGSVTAVYRIW